MAKSVGETVRTFFSYMAQCNCDKASDYMEKQRLMLSSEVWPNSMSDILCDFALAEKNYSYTNFMPAKTLISEQRENKNYLDFVYKTLFQDLEKLQIDIEDSDVSTLIASLIHFISVRLKLLEFYDKLHNIGLSNSYINFSELTETIVNLQNEFNDPSPIDEVVNILQYELESIVNLLKCHSSLENWSYLDSLLSMKKGSDAIDLWEECYQNKQARKFGSLFKSITPALISWFKSFKLYTVKKFSLYFHKLLSEDQLFEEMEDESFSNNLYFFNKLKILQKKSEAKSVILVFDASELKNFRGPDFFSPLRDVEDSHVKHQIMLSYPKVQVELVELEKLLSENNKKEDSLKNVSLININDVTYLLMRLDLRVSLVMFYDCLPKAEEKERANLLELATQLRCHEHFVSINRHKENN